MAELRVQQFDQRLLTATSPTGVYTVPAGHRAILKSVNMAHQTSEANRLRVWADTYKLLDYPLSGIGSAGANYDWLPWIVLEAGQVLNLSLLSTGSVYVVCSGTLHYV